MASNYTENYNLCQWEATDQVLRTEFNEDNAKIDESLKNLDITLKAQGNIQSEQSNMIAQHADAISKLGNCQLYTTSYSGTGKYGSANKNSLTFPKQPVLMIIFYNNFIWFSYSKSKYAIAFSSGGSGYTSTCSVSGNTVSWYSDSAMGQMNISSMTYHVVALLDSGT